MKESAQKIFEFAEFKFDTDGNILLRDGAVVPLEPMASRVLLYFLENDGRLISKDEILDTVWRDVFTTEDVLKRAVSQIRRALGESGRTSRFIETHHRRGYRFSASSMNGQEPSAAQPAAKNTDPNFECFVGRGQESAALEAELRRVKNGAGQPVLIVGEPGIGKTQTAAHFASWAEREEGVLALRVRFFDYEASFLPPFDVFLDLLREACEVIFGSGDGWRKNAEAKLKISLPEELFEKQPGAGRQGSDALRLIGAISDSFVALSRQKPLALIFDDIQWADQTSQKIIGHLMRASAGAPLMIVGLTRRGELEDKKSDLAAWLQKQAVYRSFTTLELAPLSAGNCRALIGEVFRGEIGLDKISGGDLAKLHTATGGNPYFLVETLRLLMSENVIERDGGRWHWRGLEDVPLPETARMAARAKLSSVSAAAHEVVECAAVLGDTFLIRTLGLMAETESEGAMDAALDEAISAQILTEQNVGGGDDCQFYHTTLRRAVYMDLSPRRRKRLHTRAIRAIETSHQGDLERFAAVIAAHAEGADEFEKSLELNLQAARAAVARYDWLEAAELIARAERVIERGKLAETQEYLALRGEAFMSVGRRADAEKILMKAAENSTSPRVWHNLGKTRILLGKYREAVEPLERSLQLARMAKDTFAESAALIQIASATYGLCEYEKSCEILQKIIDGEPATSYNRAVAMGKLGWTRALQSRYAEAKKLLEEALHFHDTAGDLRERAVLSMCLNTAEYGTGNHESAIVYANRARAEAQIVGEPYSEAMAMMRIARSRIAQGLYDEAEELLLGAQEKQKTLESKHARAETLWMLGRVRMEKGEFRQAEEDLETARNWVVEVGDRDDEFQIWNDQARLELGMANFRLAADMADRSAAIAKEIGVEEGIGEALVVKSEALSGLGRDDEAIAAARESVRILEEFVAGERWMAHHALAKALVESGGDAAEIEASLRRAVEILDSMRGQFDPSDERRYFEFTRNLNGPARDLLEYLDGKEAEDIEREWMIG